MLMLRRERRAKRAATTPSSTRALMAATARQVRILVASRRQPRRPAALPKPVLIPAARQTRQRPDRAVRVLVLTRKPRRPPRRADRAVRRLVLTCTPWRLLLLADLAVLKRRRTELQVSAQPQQTPARADRRKHHVRRAASRTQRQPTAGVRKPSTMGHPSVPPARRPAPRPCKAPAATADGERFFVVHEVALKRQLHNRARNHNFVAFTPPISARLI